MAFFSPEISRAFMTIKNWQGFTNVGPKIWTNICWRKYKWVKKWKIYIFWIACSNFEIIYGKTFGMPESFRHWFNRNQIRMKGWLFETCWWDGLLRPRNVAHLDWKCQCYDRAFCVAPQCHIFVFHNIHLWWTNKIAFKF